jgi:hypothetical protein
LRRTAIAGTSSPLCPRRAGPAGPASTLVGQVSASLRAATPPGKAQPGECAFEPRQKMVQFPAWDRRPPNFEQPRMDDLPPARPSEHPDWRAPTRSFTRFQAGAEKSRNAAQSRSGAALAITGGQGAEHRGSSRFCRRSVGHALRSASGADAQAHRHREHPRPSARH